MGKAVPEMTEEQVELVAGALRRERYRLIKRQKVADNHETFSVIQRYVAGIEEVLSLLGEST